MNAYDYIISQLLSGRKDVEMLKREAARKLNLPFFVKNSEILKHFPKEKLTKNIVRLLKRKPVRTLSGVAPIAVMIKPKDSCPFSCIYCPSSEIAPKSYIGYEPATRRARDNDFDSYKQVISRLKQYELNGHNTDKCEIIVMGGTFLTMPDKYKEEFIKGIYDALNNYKSSSLTEAISRNESSKHRAIGLTIETRPDVCGKKEIFQILSFGCTKVELGVQTLDNKIYKIIKRGHSIKDVVVSTRLLKDSAFKVSYHMMLGLPGSNPKKDINMFKELFSNPNFRPDMLKIYPTLVIPGTKLYEMYERGEYEPYSSDTAADIIANAYKYIPKYVRVMRINRDIPTNFIYSGVKKSNLRELVEKKLSESKIKVKEIRFREIKNNLEHTTFDISFMEYKASLGKEVFIAYENKKYIAGFVRIRLPYEPFIPELENSAFIRELRVYGESTSIGKKGYVQHKGIGTLLLSEAEEWIKQQGFDKVNIISGVGVREYYYKRGYKLGKYYVFKNL